jgi:hypothetical protein
MARRTINATMIVSSARPVIAAGTTAGERRDEAPLLGGSPHHHGRAAR